MGLPPVPFLLFKRWGCLIGGVLSLSGLGHFRDSRVCNRILVLLVVCI